MEKQRNYNDNVLDIFRLVATAQVFLGHVITHFQMADPPFIVVYFIRGVPILFALCGFLAAKSIEKKDTRTYLTGRAFRILPDFWACIALNTVLIALLYTTKPTVIEAFVYFVTQFLGLNFYTGDWLRDYGVGVPNGVLWTISVQIQFFIMVPLLHKVLAKRSLRFWIALILACACLAIAVESLGSFVPSFVYKLLGVTTLPYLYFLLIGMMAWYQRETVITFLEQIRWIVLPLYVIWKLCEVNFSFPHVFDGVLYNVVTTILLSMLIFAFGFRKRVRVKRDYTYGFFLFHMVVINVFVEEGVTALSGFWGVFVFIVIIIITLIIAWLTNTLVDKSLEKYIQRKSMQ